MALSSNIRAKVESPAEYLSAGSYPSAAGLAPGAARILTAAAYPATILVSAFLLFQVEPMMGKFILPWFGGAQAVWTTCILFFQLMLLAGYAYAHSLGTRCSLRRQASIHLGVLALCVISMSTLAIVWHSPIMPPSSWKPDNPDNPIGRILILLLSAVGLPFFVLSATAPLLQTWFARTRPDASPYPLYALSNLGAMLGLLTYPFLVETNLTLHSQAHLWFMLYVWFAAGIAICGLGLRRLDCMPASEQENAAPHPNEVADSSPTAASYCIWIALAACPSLMFLAVTNELCQDIAAAPFLWILPLSIYLMSFIFCFGNEHWYRRAVFNPLLAGAIVLSCRALYQPSVKVFAHGAIYLFLLACACIVCHGELVRQKPHKAWLTSFYLTVSGGGALGSLFGAIAAPWLFRGYWELQLSIGACAALLIVVLYRDRQSWINQRKPVLAVMLLAAAVLMPQMVLPAAGVRRYFCFDLVAGAAILLGSIIARREYKSGEIAKRYKFVAVSASAGVLMVAILLLCNVRARLATSVFANRSFYGAFTVMAQDANDPAWRSNTLRHGRIRHGMQFLTPDKRKRPTTYYGPGSGIGLLMLHHPQRLATHPESRGLRVGIVGLGAGTIAAYGRGEDYIRFYEIDPAIIEVAAGKGGFFSYVRDSPARVEIVAGDGRLSMERELAAGRSRKFDVLVIDAFTSDAIPVHLLTRQAFAVYLGELAPDGVLALHISNRYLDLRPVLKRSADYFNLYSGWLRDSPKDRFTEMSDWVLLSRNARVLGQPAFASRLKPLQASAEVAMWTDDYSNLFQILR